MLDLSAKLNLAPAYCPVGLFGDSSA